MGLRYVKHPDMCGCKRCAIQAESENPRAVYDVIDDPDVLDCGCTVYDYCSCDDYDDDYGEDE